MGRLCKICDTFPMTWSKAWTASEPVTSNQSYNRVMREFMTTALVGRGWTVQEPPTDNDNDTSANTYFLTKTFNLFAGRTATQHSILHTEANTDDTVYCYWDGDQADVADGWAPPSSSQWWGAADFDPAYASSSGAFYGTWEMWISDQDTDSFIVIGGAPGSRRLIGWQEPAGTRYVGPSFYDHFPIGGITANGPEIKSLGSNTAYYFRSSLNPGNTLMTNGDGPFLSNYPVMHVVYSTTRYPWGRITTNDWFELTTVSNGNVGQAVSATTYNGDNYIKIGGTIAWAMNTGSTVPVL